MSTKSETFYGIVCDFPGCGTLFDSGEYQYTSDPGDNADLAREEGWLTDLDGKDYCSDHTVIVECPPFETGYDYCQWCEDNGTDQHLLPMADTLHNRIATQMGRALSATMARFDRAIWKLEQKSRQEREYAYSVRKNEIQREHRRYIVADPEYQRLGEANKQYYERERELRVEAEELFGKAY
jgi:hypothetical protein